MCAYEYKSAVNQVPHLQPFRCDVSEMRRRIWYRCCHYEFPVVPLAVFQLSSVQGSLWGVQLPFMMYPATFRGMWRISYDSNKVWGWKPKWTGFFLPVTVTCHCGRLFSRSRSMNMPFRGSSIGSLIHMRGRLSLSWHPGPCHSLECFVTGCPKKLR